MNNPWEHTQTYEGTYVDFEKELYRFPDKVNTTVDMRLTFRIDNRTCYYQLLIRTDKYGEDFYNPAAAGVDWDVGLAMLGSEVELPEELR